MFSMNLNVLCAILLVGFTSQIVDGAGFGSCPNYPSMPNFNISKFTGNWYEVERSFYLLEIASGCTTLNFQKNSKGQIEVAAKSLNRWTGNPSIILGTATPTAPGSSILKYEVSSRLPTALARMLPGAGKYHILYTDYDNFAILWSCSNLRFAYLDQIWILGRKRELPAHLRADIYSALTELQIDFDRLTISKNADCPNAL